MSVSGVSDPCFVSQPGAPLIAQSQTDKAYQLIEQGIRYLDNQQWDYALSMFNQAISIDPSIPYGYLYLAR